MTFSLKQTAFIVLLFTSVVLFGQDGSLIDYSKGAEYEIAGLRVDGSKNLDARILITLSGLAKGDKIKIPGEEIPKAIKTLWRQKLFTNVEILAEKIEGSKIYL